VANEKIVVVKLIGGFAVRAQVGDVDLEYVKGLVAGRYLEKYPGFQLIRVEVEEVDGE